MGDDDGFSHNIVTGIPVRVRRVIYTGHASSIYSVDRAAQILDQVGQLTKSEDVLPFALKLVEGEDCIEIAEDNNEFGCGDALARCLENYEGYNIMVCVSRHVEGCYVSDMMQPLKIRAVKDAAISALDILFKQLKTSTFHFAEGEVENPVTVTSFSGVGIGGVGGMGTAGGVSGVESRGESRKNSNPSVSAKTPSLGQSFAVSLSVKKPITLDPFSNPTLESSKKNKARIGKLAKLQFRMTATR